MVQLVLGYCYRSLFSKRQNNGRPRLCCRDSRIPLSREMHKYNRGRLMRAGRIIAENSEGEEDEIKDIDENNGNEDPNPNVSSRIYGSWVQGPWVFGSCWRHNEILERRFLWLKNNCKNPFAHNNEGSRTRDYYPQ